MPCASVVTASWRVSRVSRRAATSALRPGSVARCAVIQRRSAAATSFLAPASSPRSAASCSSRRASCSWSSASEKWAPAASSWTRAASSSAPTSWMRRTSRAFSSSRIRSVTCSAATRLRSCRMRSSASGSPVPGSAPAASFASRRDRSRSARFLRASSSASLADSTPALARIDTQRERALLLERVVQLVEAVRRRLRQAVSAQIPQRGLGRFQRGLALAPLRERRELLLVQEIEPFEQLDLARRRSAGQSPPRARGRARPAARARPRRWTAAAGGSAWAEVSWRKRGRSEQKRPPLRAGAARRGCGRPRVRQARLSSHRSTLSPRRQRDHGAAVHLAREPS